MTSAAQRIVVAWGFRMSGKDWFAWDRLSDDIDTLKNGYDWVTESWDVWNEIEEVYQWTGENIDAIKESARPGELTVDDLEFFIQLVRVLKMINKFNVPVVGNFVDKYLDVLSDTLLTLQALFPAMNFTERLYQQWKPLIEAGQVDEGTMGIPLEMYDQMRLRFLREEYEAIRRERIAERRRSERAKHREEYESRSRINPKWYWHWWQSKISYLGPNLDPTATMLALVGIFAFILLAGGAFFFLGGDDDATAAQPGAPTAVAGAATTPTPTPTPTPEATAAVRTPEEIVAALPPIQQPAAELMLLICGPVAPDDFCDEPADIIGVALDDVPSTQTVHSSNSVEPKAPDRAETRVRANGDLTLDLSAEARHRIFTNTVFPCDATPSALTLCPNPLGSAGAGEHLAIVMVLDDELEYGPTDNGDSFVYAFVFDGDGEEANNFRAGPQFPNDFYDNTDVWYELIRDGTGWRLAVSLVRGGGWMPVESAARAIIYRNTIMLVVPVEEFDVSRPPYRMTSFWHRGDFGMNPPHDWSGAVLPPVGQPLRAPGNVALTVSE